MQKIAVYLLIGVILVAIILIFASNLLVHSTLANPYKTKVIDIEYGNNIILSNGKVMLLVGCFIPYKGTNYRPELIENINNLLVEKNITVKEVLKYSGKGKGYPIYPMVEAYFEDGTMVNEKLLKEGMAFYDHGYYKGKEKYERLQEEAKSNKRGIWGTDNAPVVVYVGSRKWRFIHYSECPEVKKIKEEDKIEYYFFPPDVFGAKYFAYDCKYRKEIEKKRKIDSTIHDYSQP